MTLLTIVPVFSIVAALLSIYVSLAKINNREAALKLPPRKEKALIEKIANLKELKQNIDPSSSKLIDRKIQHEVDTLMGIKYHSEYIDYESRKFVYAALTILAMILSYILLATSLNFATYPISLIIAIQLAYGFALAIPLNLCINSAGVLRHAGKIEKAKNTNNQEVNKNILDNFTPAEIVIIEYYNNLNENHKAKISDKNKEEATTKALKAEKVAIQEARTNPNKKEALRQQLHQQIKDKDKL